jgi:hypothetical protein
MSQFVAFSKIPRLNRDIIITEKIDGTNAAILIEQPIEDSVQPGILLPEGHPLAGCVVRAQSRSRFISPEKDNHGFATWVFTNAEQLAVLLGVGLHFGEWWGRGINAGYGLTEKRFSLFNATRWKEMDALVGNVFIKPVPVLYEGPWFIEQAPRRWAPDAALDTLRDHGSLAAPGFSQPEGIVVFHVASGHLYKATLVGDEKPKGVRDEA